MTAPAEPPVSSTGSGSFQTKETLGRYRLLKKIARGGMAEVYAARSFGAHGFEKSVAIKRILPKYGRDPQFVRMMVDEAKITVLLNHPNVATVQELCEQDGDYFIVMEFVPGQSLSALGKRLREKNERLGNLEACFVVVELLQGLHAAHKQLDVSGNPAHIIHRDVSPQNVLLSFDGHVKVIDFGIARARHRLEMTEVGTIKGKLRYLAPEMIDPVRFMKSGDFDHRVDVFAAGIILWELLAGRTLYAGDDEMAVYDLITDVDAPDLATLGACDQALAKIVKRALARDPEQRFPSAEELADELRAYVYRTDPAFTHRRIAAVLDKHFPLEKEEMLALERGQGPVAHDGETAPAQRAKSYPAPEPAAPGDPTKTLGASGERFVAAAAGPMAGGILTALTLVSRPSVSGPNQPDVKARVAEFIAGSETLTVNESKILPSNSLPNSPPNSETPYTRGPAAGTDIVRRAPRARRLLIPAAAGVLIAGCVIVALEVSRRPPVVVTEPPEREPIVDTPVIEPVVVPSNAVALQLRVIPATAAVVVNGAPYVAGMSFPPGPVMVHASAPGFVALKKEIELKAATPVSEELVLAAVEVEKPVVDKPVVDKPVVDKPAVDTRKGKLVLKTKDLWGQVTIDGKAYDETTPLTVELKAGKHNVVVEHPPKGLKKSFAITVKPGETTTRMVELE